MALSKRWIMVLLMNSGIMIEYCLRVNMSVAVIQMASEFAWTDYQKGLMLSSFYWGYAIGQIPANVLVYYFGAKSILGYSVLLSSLLTFLFPSACYISLGTGLLVRALVGLAASATFPACFHFFPLWIPKAEKTLLVTAIMSGKYLGEIICFSVSGVLVTSHFTCFSMSCGGWPAAFYSFAVLGILWCPVWLFCAYESPADHPTITPEELNYINYGTISCFSFAHMIGEIGDYKQVPVDNLDVELTASSPPPSAPAPIPLIAISPYNSYQRSASDNADNPSPAEIARRIPWAAFFRHPVALTLLFAYWTNNWIAIMMLSEIPSYLTNVLHFNLKDAGVLSMLPYCAQFIATVCFGQLFYHLQKSAHWQTRTVRQVAQFISFGGAGLCLLLCGFIHDVHVAFACMVLGLGLYGASQSGIACAFLDVSPNYSSTLNTIANVFGSIAGIVSPLVVSAFTAATPGIWGWRYVFIVTAVQCCIALYFWAVHQTSDVVPLLNTPRPRKTSRTKEWCPWFRY